MKTDATALRPVAALSSRPDLVDPGPAPVLQWIRIDDLVVDDSYQRELKIGNRKAIRKIAEGFRWSRFSPVFVSPCEGGRFAIIDGQHRTHAAKICGFSEVPCQIVHMTRQEQAAAFAAVNGVVTAVTPWQIYKAALAAGEGWAVGIDIIARDGGCQVMTQNCSSFDKKPGQIYAVVAFRKLFENRPAETISQALRVLMGAEGYCDNPEIWANNILFPLLNAMTERPRAINNPEFAAALEQFDIMSEVERIDARAKNALRMGLGYEPKKLALETAVISWIDRTFPERMALPKAGAV